MSKWPWSGRIRTGMAGMAAGVMLLLALSMQPATSADGAPAPQGGSPTNDSCLACHEEQGMTAEIGGQVVPLTIQEDQFLKSVHGTEEIACVDCHTNITGFPHPEVVATSPRDFSLQLYQTCQQCHSEQYQKVLDSVHQSALAAGNTNAAICTDCHNPHTQPRLTDPDSGELLQGARFLIPQTCARCHSTIHETYKESVHGAALSQEGDPFVPTCIDCHGVHDIDDPTSNSFRNSTPFLCANCHTNQTLMRQYGLSTNVLDTYVADFHGTTIKMFEESFPDQPTNQPVCTDCHGIHDILRVEDPQAGIAFKTNLLARCQQCHPDATTASFTDSWLSHYEPSPEVFPLVYYVNLFYRIFIPLVIGGMTFYVLTDAYRRFLVPRLKRKGGAEE